MEQNRRRPKRCQSQESGSPALARTPSRRSSVFKWNIDRIHYDGSSNSPEFCWSGILANDKQRSRHSDHNHSDSKSDRFMLSTTDINELSKKRMWILIPAATVGVAVMLAYFAVVAAWRDSLVASARQSFGESTADALPIVLILPSIGFFLTALIWGEHKSKRHALICPNCNVDLSRSTKRVAATRCCNSCGKQIVEGPRTHGPEAFERRSRIEQRKFLIYWFWAWPILGSLMIGYHWLSPTGFEDCPHIIFYSLRGLRWCSALVSAFSGDTKVQTNEAMIRSRRTVVSDNQNQLPQLSHRGHYRSKNGRSTFLHRTPRKQPTFLRRFGGLCMRHNCLVSVGSNRSRTLDGIPSRNVSFGRSDRHCCSPTEYKNRH